MESIYDFIYALDFNQLKSREFCMYQVLLLIRYENVKKCYHFPFYILFYIFIISGLRLIC